LSKLEPILLIFGTVCCSETSL